jgi:pyrimidine operon attenuation protein/uracil phosphoribosyltransferase
MPQSQVLVLDKNQIQQKINRIAYQILEDNFDEKEIILAGIWDRGYKLALRLQTKLQEIATFNVKMLRVDIERQATKLIAKTDLSETEWKNKVVILVDDVLNTGKTLAYGLGVFLNTPHKKIRTVVLVDRSHKIFPISTDFVGLELATILKEHVDVIMDVEGEEDRVYLS